MCEKNLDLLQICQPFFDFHLSSIKFCIEFYITIRFTTSFKTMIINLELCSECKVWWVIFGITVVILIGCFVFKCLWGKNIIKRTIATKVVVFTKNCILHVYYMYWSIKYKNYILNVIFGIGY